jgi:hypothetical protein
VLRPSSNITEKQYMPIYSNISAAEMLQKPLPEPEPHGVAVPDPIFFFYVTIVIDTGTDTLTAQNVFF